MLTIEHCILYYVCIYTCGSSRIPPTARLLMKCSLHEISGPMKVTALPVTFNFRQAETKVSHSNNPDNFIWNFSGQCSDSKI